MVKKHELIKLILEVGKALEIRQRDIVHIRRRDLFCDRTQSVSIHHGLRKQASSVEQGCGALRLRTTAVVLRAMRVRIKFCLLLVLCRWDRDAGLNPNPWRRLAGSARTALRQSVDSGV